MSRLKEKGTFRTTKSGSIEYRVPYYDEKGIRRIKSFTCDSKGECVERASEFLHKMELKHIAIDKDATVSDILQKFAYSEYTRNYISESGYDKQVQVINIIKRGAIGTIPIAHINEEMLREYIESLGSYSNSVIRKVYAKLKKAFAIAYEKGIVKSNFMIREDMKIPTSFRKDKKVRAMTEEEQKKFVETLMKYKVPYGRNTYKIQLLLELYTGMRMGEINALKPENVNFRGGYIHVEATISRGIDSRNFFRNHPKTDAGIRDVPMSDPVKDLLHQAINEMIDNPKGLIFYDHNKNDVIATYQVGMFYKRVCEKAGIEYYGQHALRHTFATRCIEAGVPALVLKKWLGHTNIHITLDTYADVFGKLNSTSIKKYDGLINSINNG